ncbi:MAG: sulfatase-like hydrolase/transferase [Verrucomicrobiae bacterium]|nr:sulfatase-like hydrolase/transferase [Verrucomicrobiae bacterium]NNJ44293.1 sulfatase-like hydrolase/transferase [Akkermansiaceae bacterium]
MKFTLWILLFATFCGSLTAAEKPHFLIIFTDDQGYGDLSAYGKTDIVTPNMDRIGKEGMLFTQMRANCTVCTPSRAALLTGKYADRVGAPGVIRTDPDSSWGYLDPSVPTLADELKKVGYHTALVGKWHLGLESPNIPNDRGFDFFHGFLGDMMNDYYHCKRGGIQFLRKNKEVVEPTKHATDMFTDWANAYLKERSQKPDEPFFLYLAYNAPHFPVQPPQEWVEKVRKREPEMSKARARSVAFVEHLDAAIGRVLGALDTYGLANNTVVVFTSDNGGSLRHHQNNDPWRGGKQDHYDGGLKVPFAMRWPGGIKAGTTSDYQGLGFDIFPTFLEIAGAHVDEDLDGVSLMPVLKGEAMNGSRELYFVRREGGAKAGKAYQAIIADGWKLMQNDPFSPLELYHIKEDPQETNNLVSTEKEKLKQLSDRLRYHIQRGGSTPWQKPSP